MQSMEENAAAYLGRSRLEKRMDKGKRIKYI
jgi:hypothetical protein